MSSTMQDLCVWGEENRRAVYEVQKVKKVNSLLVLVIKEDVVSHLNYQVVYLCMHEV
jgi:hypothetical protein